MIKTTRRNFLNRAGMVVGGLCVSGLFGAPAVLIGRGRRTDICIEHIRFGFEEYSYRAPVKFAGAVVKSPKGLSNMLLVAAAAGKEKILLCGGDMSCPGGALIQTAGLQARVPTITSVEANVRQFFPQGNQGWESKFPGIFRSTDGMLQTAELNQPGLGA
ncbi:MAG: hypothetical protein EXS37_16510 [Opitutus sp.]|nr:hypothetical protein [Opitutus sp.]